MYGYLTLCAPEEKQRRAVRCGVKPICGVRFYEVYVQRSRSRFVEKRRLRRAARLMERAGVRRALFPEGFSETGLFESCGVQAAQDGYLRTVMAAEIARRMMDAQGFAPTETCVALIGDAMTPALRRTLMELALRVRYTLLSAGGGGGESCSVLRREYGVSVLRNAGEEQLRRADVVLTFGKASPCGKEGCLWLPFGEVTKAEGYENALRRVTCLASPAIEAALPDGCSRSALLSVLLELGAVRPNELEVAEVGERRHVLQDQPAE